MTVLQVYPLSHQCNCECKVDLSLYLLVSRRWSIHFSNEFSRNKTSLVGLSQLYNERQRGREFFDGSIEFSLFLPLPLYTQCPPLVACSTSTGSPLLSSAPGEAAHYQTSCRGRSRSVRCTAQGKCTLILTHKNSVLIAVLQIYMYNTLEEQKGLF